MKSIPLTKQKLPLIVIFLTSLLFSIGSFTLRSDAPILSNDSYFYMKYAKELRESGFHFYANTDAPPYYWLFPHVIAFSQIFSQEHFTYICILINCLLSAFGILLCYRIMRLLNIHELLAIMASIFYAVLPECFQWNHYVLSDPVFLFIHTLLVYATIRMAQEDTHKLNLRILYIVSTALILFSRPVGFIPLGISLAFLAIHYYKKNTTLQLMVMASIPFILFGGSMVLFKATEKSSDKLEDYTASGYTSTFTDWFEEGMIIHDRPNYNIESLGNQSVLMHYSKVFSLRWIHFWNPLIESYSLKHKLINAVTILPLFLLFFVSTIWHALSSFSNWLRLEIKSLDYLLLIILVFTTFHAMTLIDYDHRYRYPHLFLVIIFSTFYIQRFLKRFCDIKS